MKKWKRKLIKQKISAALTPRTEMFGTSTEFVSKIDFFFQQKQKLTSKSVLAYVFACVCIFVGWSDEFEKFVKFNATTNCLIVSVCVCLSGSFSPQLIILLVVCLLRIVCTISSIFFFNFKKFRNHTHNWFIKLLILSFSSFPLKLTRRATMPQTAVRTALITNCCRKICYSA